MERAVTEPVHTPEGLPGFDGAREWVLEHDHEVAFALLRNVDEPGIGLLVVEPWELAPGYEPDLPDAELARIDISEPSDVQLYVVATLAPSGTAESGPAVWLNLAAPIAINVRNRKARQVILDRQGWPLRHPVGARS
jgi:flagellar assembly factor FliW